MTESSFFNVEVYSPVGVRTVNAIGISRIRETYQRRDEERFQMEKSLDGKVEFQCDDYEYFKTLSESDRRYDDVKAKIETLCNGVLSVKWLVFIEIRKGVFDHERKTFTCSFSLDNVNRNFEKYKSQPVNILDKVSARLETTANYPAGVIYANGVPVYHAFLAMFREALIIATITSDFFQWNTANTTYTIGHNTKLTNQGLFHKSDLVKASSTGYAPATIMNLSLEDLIGNLCRFYNMRWILDAAGNFRIEHVSWFAIGASFDLTLAKYAEPLKGSRQFSFDETKIFRLEKFKNPGSINIDFVGVPIEYDNALIKYMRNATGHFEKVEEGEEDVLERTVDFITDIDAVYGNIGVAVQPTPDREADLDGIALIALDASGNIQKVNGILETNPVQRNNNVNSWAVLHEDYWKHGRLFPTGIMNKAPTAFFDVQKIKIRKPINIPFCCDETIDLESLVTTEYGEAEIRKAVFNEYQSTLELTLAYEDVDSISLGAPTCVNDVYGTTISTVLNTSTAGKPALLANDTGVTSVLAETKPTLLGGSVVIGSNGHFIYTPPAGISGTDQFDYIGLNGSGRTDIGTAVIIIHVAGVYIHATHTEYWVPVYAGVGGGGINIVGSGAVISGVAYRVYRLTISFYEDATLQLPLDLTGYGITIPYSFNMYGFVGGTTVIQSGSGTLTAAGTSVDLTPIAAGLPPNATGAFTYGYTVPPPFPPLGFTITITPSPNYTII